MECEHKTLIYNLSKQHSAVTLFILIATEAINWCVLQIVNSSVLVLFAAFTQIKHSFQLHSKRLFFLHLTVFKAKVAVFEGTKDHKFANIAGTLLKLKLWIKKCSKKDQIKHVNVQKNINLTWY